MKRPVYEQLIQSLRLQMPGMLFIVHEDEYGYEFITDCPNPARIKELVREACIKYRIEEEDELSGYITSRFELAGYWCISTWDVVSPDMWFDAEDE